MVNNKADIIMSSSQSVSAHRLKDILTVYNNSARTKYPDVGEVRDLISKLSHDDVTSLSKVLHDALWEAAWRDHTEITNSILVSLPHKYRLHVLVYSDWTPLHRAAEDGYTDSVRAIMSHLSSEEQLKLLSVQHGGETPIDDASEEGHTDTERVLRDYKERAEKQINTAKPAVVQPSLPRHTKQQEKRGGVNVSEIVSIMANGKAFIDLTKDLTINIPTIDEPHYQMTRTRGRVCIISNSFTGARSRHGSEHDYNNLQNMFTKLGFVVAGQHKSFTAEEIVSTIHAETQLIVKSGRSVHEDLGMFVLVITSHGTEGNISGSDDILIKLTDIYDLLSAKHFPAMKDKPKLIIIQACGGGRRERFVDDSHRGATSMSYNQSDSRRTADVTPHHTNTNYLSRGASNITADAQQADISVANLLIMQSSFDSFLAFRDTNVGSQFIRAITATFLKYAHLYDVEMLGKIVQESVSMYGVQISQEYDTTRDDERYITQMPKIISTLTGFRKIYLQPGVNMHIGSHPTSVRNPLNPSRPTTQIVFLTDLVREERRGYDHIVRTTTLQFKLEKP